MEGQDPTEASNEPKKSGWKGGKRKRNLSYRPYKGKKNQKSSKPRPDNAVGDNVDQAPSVPNPAIVLENVDEASPVPSLAIMNKNASSFKKTSKTEMATLLKRCHKQLTSANREKKSLSQTVKSLQDKNTHLKECTRTARELARNSKMLVKETEQNARATKKQLEKQIREEVALSQIQLSHARSEAQAELSSLRKELQHKDTAAKIELSAMKREMLRKDVAAKKEMTLQDAAAKREMAAQDAAAKREMAAHDAAAKREMAAQDAAAKREMAAQDAAAKKEMADLRKEMQQKEDVAKKELAAVQQKVDQVKELEQGRRARAVAVEKRKAEVKLKRSEVEFNSILKKKDSQIEFVSNVATENRKLTTELQSEVARFKLHSKKEMERKDVAHAHALSQVKKRSAMLIQKKNNDIKKMQAEVVNYQALAEEMAEEHFDICKQADKQFQESTRQIKSLNETATKRLHKYKAAHERARELKDDLDEQKYGMSQDLLQAQSEIRQLKQELLRKTEETEELEVHLSLAQDEIDRLSTFHRIKKVGNPKTWDHKVTQIIVEMLSHRTPPSCIAANILTVVKVLMPNAPIIDDEMPRPRFVRYCRSVLLHATKTLAAYEIAVAKLYSQLFTDGTGRRQTDIQNVVMGIITDAGYRQVSLDGCVIANGRSSEDIVSSIVVAFRESGKLLERWRSVTAELFPDRPELVELIPSPEKLSLSKLCNNGMTMTDTCNTAQKIQDLLEDAISKIAKDEGLSPQEIKIRKSDCWQHLRNVWFGGVGNVLNESLVNRLADCLESLPQMYRIDMDAEDLYRCTEKNFSGTANYAKGDGSDFGTYMPKYNPGAYLYPLARACGGTRQDLIVEGAPAVLMNIPYYLQFLSWKMGVCGTSGDGILATKLWLMYRSVEVIALLRILSILHISICLPVRWLAGNTQELADYDFGYYDMGKVLDLMERAFEDIVEDPKLILDEDFMMNIFSEISNKVDPFQEYLDYMFTEKLSIGVSKGRSINEKVLPYDELRAALFYPHRVDILQTDALCYELAAEAAAAFLIEFRDTSKVTHQYLSSIGGKFSLASISETDRKAGLGKEASNSISESCHAAATQSLKTCGTIRLDNAAAEGQARFNKHFERNLDRYSKKHQDKNGNSDFKDGLFFDLREELQESLIVAAKRGAPALRKDHDHALKIQKEGDLKRKEAEHKMQQKKLGEKYIESVNYHELYKSERCWKDEDQALEEYHQLGSETAMLKAVKEQICIRWKGFGWNDAHHPWSRQGHIFSSKELMDHFINTVLPMEKERGPPDEPPLKSKLNSEHLMLGTKSDLTFEHPESITVEQMKQDALQERNQREEDGLTDRDATRQRYVMPLIDDNLIGFNIEYCFTYTDEDGSSYDAWCDGVVKKIINKKTRMVLIEWNEKKVHKKDKKETRHKLLVRSWNPKNPRGGAWRQYFGDPNE